MDDLIGRRFNLISKSEIRYFGSLHEINPEQSTIALEDVYSYGTEGRENSPDDFVPASQQKFDYIVFRGSDVKDIKMIQDENENEQRKPQNVLNDPAILNAPRAGPPTQHQLHGQPPPNLGQQPQKPVQPPQGVGQPPFPPPGYPPQPQFGSYYPPQQYGRGYGPPPGNFGPGPGYNMPYGPPPPGYFGPGGQPYPPIPNMHSPSQMSIGRSGQRPPGPPGHHQPPPPGYMQPTKPTSELPVNDRAISKTTSKASTPAPSQDAPIPPVDSKPPVSEALAPPPQVPSQPADVPLSFAAAAKPSTSGPKSNKVAPAVPFTVNQRSFVPPASATNNGPLAPVDNAQQSSKPAPSAAAMEEASRQAKEAVAAAMAKLNPQAAQAKIASNSNAMDALTRKVGEMRTSDGSVRGTRGGVRGPRGSYRGGSGGQTRKIEIPNSDYDFESANAKFNKEDMIKEAIASGSPIGETPGSTIDGTNGIQMPATENGEGRKDSFSHGPATQSYNKASSFFDNISSEIKDREEERAQPRGRGRRGEEFKKNYETFGQGSVDGGGFRGRGRGYRGRGRPYGGQNRGFAGRGVGYGAGFRGQSGNGQELGQS